MRLRLKTKFTLTTALLVLGVVASLSTVYIARLTGEVLRQTDDRANFVARQLYVQAREALADAARQGAVPASGSDTDIREFVRRTLEASVGVTSLVEAAVGYSESIYEISLVDSGGTTLLSSDTAQPGRAAARRALLGTLTEAGFVSQLGVLYGPPRVYEVRHAVDIVDKPFGEIRVGISSALLRNEISPGLRAASWLVLVAVVFSTLLAALVSHFSLAPLAKISAQLDRISQGQFDAAPIAPGDELGQVSTKIDLIGQQLRGVREIFSTLRENLEQVMSGLEDGLLLFAGDGRAVLVSPSVEKFLGARPQELLGRRVSEVFPSWHPLRQVLRGQGEELEALASAEADLDGGAPGRISRIGVHVQVISESGEGPERMGTLVTLRDLDSLDRLGSQLQISERMAALGRVTAGVAHEVKNPLNSMRLWIENLKGSLPGANAAPGTVDETALRAVKILDTEIDRLDRVVKTFLDFTRPVEMALEETPLAQAVEEALTVAQPEIARRGVLVRRELADGLRPARVDRGLLRQALLNLILNACQAMETGGELTMGLRRRGDTAELTVADTGCGIPPEHRSKIFQLFHTTRAGGTGIGLATTFRIVQLHGGSIDFESEAGRGTKFRLELPLVH